MVPTADFGVRIGDWVPASNLAGVSEFSNESVLAIESTLNNVDRALERLRVGNYRTCQACGAEIDQDELLRNPLLVNCPAHPELA
jgi:RNA polymerase-binding transcription factor DksA